MKTIGSDEKSIAKLAERFATAEGQFAKLGKSFATVEKSFAKLGEGFASVQKTFSIVEKSFGKLEIKVASVEMKVMGAEIVIVELSLAAGPGQDIAFSLAALPRHRVHESREMRYSGLRCGSSAPRRTFEAAPSRKGEKNDDRQ